MKIEIEENYIIVDGVKYVPEVKKETVLEVGKWYKEPKTNFLVCISEALEDHFMAYGFGRDGIYEDDRICFGSSTSDVFKERINILEEATEQEVFEALKNEAVKRGYKKGTYTEDLFFDPKRDSAVISSDEFDWEIAFCGKQEGKKCLRDSDGNVIFVDGKWAEIIPTITKQEAEELLNKKIV